MNRTPHHSRPLTWTVVPLLCAALLTACSSDEPADAATTDAATTSSGATASPTTATTSPSPTVAATTSPAAGATAAPAGDEGPEDSFRTWLAASRAPDTATACAYMTPELTDRMLGELTAQGLPGITDCPSMIELTAGLYAAVGQSADVEVALVEETDEHAVLDVAYASGDCGKVVLVPGAGHWVLDERSEERC
ncbi:hypothetical protein [Cellulomonas palmilytica]|uniref:hypothetical protein n=1 Tax=Cellulomonas palmilytica TaxID=2608402 RepID=UPI001F1A78C5|nr:hypothetical protein [Cellulomonas palmilytica]UJP41373.1 hypothetical protein F1D97_08130 [Cellulomonas palmilytica]